MDFRPGDIQWLKNAVILHARTEYEDAPEPARKRHLLRLWLTAHEHWSDGDAFLQQGIPKKDGASAGRRRSAAGKMIARSPGGARSCATTTVKPSVGISSAGVHGADRFRPSSQRHEPDLRSGPALYG